MHPVEASVLHLKPLQGALHQPEGSIQAPVSGSHQTLSDLDLTLGKREMRAHLAKSSFLQVLSADPMRAVALVKRAEGKEPFLRQASTARL